MGQQAQGGNFGNPFMMDPMMMMQMQQYMMAAPEGMSKFKAI